MKPLGPRYVLRTYAGLYVIVAKAKEDEALQLPSRSYTNRASTQPSRRYQLSSGPFTVIE